MAKHSYDYPRPAVTADVVLFDAREDGLYVLLIKRLNKPFAGRWALPGGFVDKDEDLPDAAKRELEEETGITDVELKQIGAFGTPGRDPRGHTITVAFAAILNTATNATPSAGDDAAEAKWFPVKKLPELAFDHNDIIAVALELIASL